MGATTTDGHDVHSDAAASREAQIAALLEPVVEGEGLFLEGVELTRAGRYSTLRVVVDLPDGPGSLDLDRVGQATGAISDALDQADPIKGSYTLEVTSPGAQRELTTPRHLRRAVGLSVELTVRSDQGQDEQVTGTLLEAEPCLVVDTEQGRREVQPDALAGARTVVVL